MSILSRLSIKRKITLMIMVISILVLGIGFAIEFNKDVRMYKKYVLENTVMNTKLIGEYCISPLFFHDKQGARDILSKLQSLDNFSKADLYDQNHELFISYGEGEDTIKYKSPGLTGQLEDSYQVFVDDHLIVHEPIIYDNQPFGYLLIKVSVLELKSKAREFLFTMMIILAGLSLFALILASWFQRIISVPIMKLAYITKEITHKADYSIRINKKTNDEIGELYDSFNLMLEQLHRREIERDKAEKNLKEAKNKAEQADKLKTAFLANMSHEIRTPMNSIIGFSGLLAEEELPKEKKLEYAGLIVNSGNALLNLVDDIIDISKIEAEQISINKSECNIQGILNELYISFSEKIRLKKLSEVELMIKKTAQVDKITLNTDPYRFRQIFTNLINNALKFTDHGFVEFGVEKIETDFITFVVRDTGIGLADDKKELIFDRFRKVDENKARLYRGAGLGLTICKKLVSLLGGKIWVDSVEGQGSQFYFTLPNEQIQATYQEPVINTKVAKSYDWSKLHILVAEDEEYNYFLLEEVLKKTKINIHWAKNGLEAVEIYKEQNINLVLMDIKMPEMNGYEATVQIKQINPDVPVIAQTAYAMVNEKEKSFEAGCDSYISKPINPKELIAILATFIESR